MSGWQRSLRQNWATPTSVILHMGVVLGFLVQFSTPAPSLPANPEVPSLAVEVMLMPTPTPDMVNTMPPPPPPPPPPLPEMVEEPPPMIESTAKAAEAAPLPPVVKKKLEPLKPTPVKRLPMPVPDSVPTEKVAEPSPSFVPPSPVVPAPQANQLALAAPAGRAGPPPNYLSLISSRLERNKIYPRVARDRRQQGRANLRFTIDRQGNVLSHELLTSTGYRLLDNEVQSLIRRVSPLPPMPADMPEERLELTVPIDFFLR